LSAKILLVVTISATVLVVALVVAVVVVMVVVPVVRRPRPTQGCRADDYDDEYQQ